MAEGRTQHKNESEFFGKKHMKKPEESDLQKLENLSQSKLSLLKVLYEKMSSSLDALKVGNTEGLNASLDEQQGICSNIDSIDSEYTPVVRALDSEIANVILSFQTSESQKYVPTWGTNLYGCVREQQELLRKISGVHKELTAKIEELSDEYLDKLRNIRSQKEFIKKYATNKNTGNFIDYKK